MGEIPSQSLPSRNFFQFAIEHCTCVVFYLLKMVIFYSYVNLPEGIFNYIQKLYIVGMGYNELTI
jgi:hypothetical protein